MADEIASVAPWHLADVTVGKTDAEAYVHRLGSAVVVEWLEPLDGGSAIEVDGEKLVVVRSTACAGSWHVEAAPEIPEPEGA